MIWDQLSGLFSSTGFVQTAFLSLLALAGAGLLIWRFASRGTRADADTQWIPEPVLEVLLRDLSPYQFAALLRPDGRILHASPAALQAWGVPPAAVTGRHLGDLPCWNEPPESRHAVHKLLLQASTGRAGQVQIACDHPERQKKLDLRISLLPGLPYLICTAQETPAAVAAVAASAVSAAPVVTGAASETALLEELAGLLPAARDLTEVCKISGAFLSRLFPRGVGALYLAADSGAGFVPQARWGGVEKISPRVDSADCWALRRGGEHWMEPGASSLCCDHALGSQGLCHVCVPLLSRGETIGLLYIEWADAADAPSRSLPRALAAQMAPALGHARASHVLREQAIRDGLTGLLNRRALDENLPKLMLRASDANRPLSILLFDVDHFKRFNDQHGHDAGDLVLRKVGQRLMDSMREGDLAFRYGGEEMLVLLPGSGAAEAALCAERLRKSISTLNLIHRGEQLPPITASVGIAEHPFDGADAESLIKWADRGLYAAKAAGRDCVIRHSQVAKAA